MRRATWDRIGSDGRQVWEADHEALLDAKLGGLKAGLKLTPDQEKLWAPFEAAVRSAAQMRMQHMQAMMERMHRYETGSTIRI